MRQTIAVLFALILLAINSTEQRPRIDDLGRLPNVAALPDFTGKTAPAHIAHLEQRNGPTLCAEVHAGCGLVNPAQHLAVLPGVNPAW